MTDAALFSFINVGVGFVVSWFLSHYFLPWFFSVRRSYGRSFTVTAVYTAAALIRNFFVYWGFV